jgi:hypothetical protein
VIRLDRTNRKLEAVLAGAITTTQPHCIVSFYDVPAQSKDDFSEYRGATKITATNSATAVTICEAPGVNGTVRNIDYISIQNRDSVSATVTVQIDDANTDYVLVSQSVAAGKTLEWTRSAGWKIL